MSLLHRDKSKQTVKILTHMLFRLGFFHTKTVAHWQIIKSKRIELCERYFW
jgi:hypothetical protein